MTMKTQPKAQMERFWETTLRPLFTEDAFDFKVKILGGSEVRYVNFDHAATTMPFKEVKQYVDGWFNTYGSVHRGAGQKSILTTAQYDATRDRVRKYVKSSSNNYVIYTKNTTESINQAATLWTAIPGRVLVSDIEHSSNLLPWVKHGEVVQYRTNRDGTVDMTEIERIVKDNASKAPEQRIKLITFTACSNITGYTPPIYEIAKLAHRYGAKVFADVCQYIPHEIVDMLPDDDPAHLDFVAFSGHKMYAPYGIGVLLGPKAFFDAQLPYHIGGGNLPYITRDLQIKRYCTERALDPGSPNAVGPVALAKAMDIYDSVGRKQIAEYEHTLAHYAYDCVTKVPGFRPYVTKELFGHVIPFDLEGFDARLVAVVMAQEYGIGLRAGAFCTYEYIRKLKGVSDEVDQRVAAEVDRGITRNIPHIVRVSFSLCNPFSDIDRLVSALAEMQARGAKEYESRYAQDERDGTWSFCGAGPVRRGARRFPVEARVEFTIANVPDVVAGQLTDVSTDGASVITDRMLEVGTLLTVHVSMPDINMTFQVRGRVAWADGGRRTLGVTFLSDDGDASKSIKQLVERCREQLAVDLNPTS